MLSCNLRDLLIMKQKKRRSRKPPKAQPRLYLDVRLENFRLFRDSTWFKIAPLTCLIGRNSSGKSSIVSALLLLKQTLEQESMGWATTPLKLSGPYCDLGNFTDVVHDHNESSEMSISISMPMSAMKPN